MNASRPTPDSIDTYIAGFSPEIQGRLQQVRAIIAKAVPAAREKISYQIPTFTLNGRILISFAAFKDHVGMYPAPIGHEDFKDDLPAFASGKATAKFPLDKQLPVELIEKIVAYRVVDNEKRAQKPSLKKA